LQPNSRKRKQRTVVDANVVAAGISGFRDQYVSGLIASADLLHRCLHVRSAAIGTLINFMVCRLSIPTKT